MTMVPKSNSSLDSLLWREISSELKGKVVSMDFLKENFPGIRILDVEETNIIYGFYGEKESSRYVAYKCLNCNEIMIGPPERAHQDSLDKSHLSGSRCDYIKCGNCSETLRTDIYEVS